MVVHRFLLDQNFPSPALQMTALDRRVEYVPLRAFDAALCTAGTPDWLIYLRAREGGFRGVITRDRSQLDEPEELVALLATGLVVVTWYRAVEDPIQEWGQLVAFMPLILRRLEREPDARIFFLPKPTLGGGSTTNARALLGRMASTENRSFPELRDEARRAIQYELGRLGRSRLASLLRP